MTSRGATTQNAVARHDAKFVLQPGHDPEFWELHAFLDAAVEDDPDLARAVATEGTEIRLDYNGVIAVVLRGRG